MYSEIPIPYYDKVKNLGVIFNCNLSWTPHINGLNNRMHECISPFVLLNIYRFSFTNSLLLPIPYTNVCYFDVTEKHIDQLLQNLASIITYPRFMISFSFKIIKYKYFIFYVILFKPSLSYTLCVLPILDIPKSSTKFFQNSFSVQASLI